MDTLTPSNTISKDLCRLGIVSFGDVATTCDDIIGDISDVLGKQVEEVTWTLYGECYELIKSLSCSIETAEFDGTTTVRIVRDHAHRDESIFIECAGSDPRLCFIHAAAQVLRQAHEMEMENV